MLFIFDDVSSLLPAIKDPMMIIIIRMVVMIMIAKCAYAQNLRSRNNFVRIENSGGSFVGI